MFELHFFHLIILRTDVHFFLSVQIHFKATVDRDNKHSDVRCLKGVSTTTKHKFLDAFHVTLFKPRFTGTFRRRVPAGLALSSDCSFNLIYYADEFDSFPEPSVASHSHSELAADSITCAGEHTDTLSLSHTWSESKSGLFTPILVHVLSLSVPEISFCLWKFK